MAAAFIASPQPNPIAAQAGARMLLHLDALVEAAADAFRHVDHEVGAYHLIATVGNV
jgi:hypothetical protein